MKLRYVLQAVLPLVLILGGIWGYVNLIQPSHKDNQPFADEPPAIPAGQPVPAVLEANPRPEGFACTRSQSVKQQ